MVSFVTSNKQKISQVATLLFYSLCAVPLPPGVNPIAVDKYNIKYYLNES